ncbi:hypothetical protein FWP32_24030 [Vibrio alginolyticus]|uniref:Uncharacterized protein n=1 Tax=Vibrio alginolyticus TaxID=663 RepID=A0A7Y4B7N5_VIBAL|nr:hypothetical protein AL545_04400 [Vibrio alginolyticus]NNN39158.1 hypothetical protein [Vibrio sp. 2-2(2)]NNN50645.1 hypothetical protein [Vibrio sp. 2-2(7)]NNN87179.1 hypothetical protein [Vibrio sp. 2-2(9)]NNO03187.1 hypothetical protein [Vibrio sp. 7-5(1-a)]
MRWVRHHLSRDLCRENEAYFNGLIYLVNKKLVFFIQMVKKTTLTNKGRSFCLFDHQYALLSCLLTFSFYINEEPTNRAS